MSQRTVGEAMERLVEIMARLRAENGCPWDREQDLRSLRPYLVEETYEVLDEMDRVGYGKGSWKDLCGELGDLMFQIVFHAQLGKELGEFDVADVCESISNKIVSRHPHVFGDKKVNGSTQVLENWARLKAEEKKKKTGSEGSVLDGVPTAAPALMRAERLTEKASRIGFDWPDLKGVREKLDEELRELDEAIAQNDRDALEMELGDVLFSLANLARFIRTPPEDALRQAIHRFVSRFHQIEAGLREQQVPFGKATLDQMEALWQRAKQKEKSLPPPRWLPRAGLQRIEIGVASVEAETRFWDRLAPLIGWSRVPRSNDARYTDGALELLFVAGESGSGRFTLEAPSTFAVSAVGESLSALGARHVERSESSVSFSDPNGVRWRYEARAR